MRILLPPSEAKRSGGRGRSLNHRAAANSARPQPIDASRQSVLAALARLVDTPAAAAALLLPPSIADEALAQNRRVASSPTLAAMRRYTGVVYDGLDVEGLSPAAQSLAGRELLICSGLFGVLRGAEAIPAYRVPAKAALPGLGILATFWRPRLAELLPPMLGRGGLVLDLRSTDYAAMWQPDRQCHTADRLLAVRVLSAKPDGQFGVISYPSKLAKGKLAAALLERQAAGLPVRSADDVATTWAALGGRDALTRTVRTGTALDLIE